MFAISIVSIPLSLLFIAGIIYILVFWIRYSWIPTYSLKWSKGEFIAPEKRFNKLMLHGLGVYAATALLMGCTALVFVLVDSTSTVAMTIMSICYIIVLPCALWLYWYIVYKIREKSGATKRLIAFEVSYGVLTLSAWVAIVVLAIYGMMFVLAIAAAYFLFRLIMYFCFSEQISVKTPGLFGGIKKVWAERNLDGSYTDLDGNKYK